MLACVTHLMQPSLTFEAEAEAERESERTVIVRKSVRERLP
jgi:hypothetical protein